MLVLLLRRLFKTSFRGAYRGLLTTGLAVLLSVVHLGDAAAESAPLLEQLARQSQQISQLQGNFQQQKFLGVLPRPIQSSGRFSFIREEGIVWETLEPIASTISLTAEEGMGRETAGQNSSRQNALVSTLFMQLLSGDYSQLETWFVLKPKGSLDNWQLELLPREDTMKVYLERIRLEGASYTKSIEIYENNGDRTQINLEVLDSSKTVRVRDFNKNNNRGDSAGDEG